MLRTAIHTCSAARKFAWSFRSNAMGSFTGTSTCRGRNGRTPSISLWFISAAAAAVLSTCPAALAQETHNVFVYGTLKTGESHHFYLEDPENGMATLLGNAETIDEWPLVVMPSSGIPYLIPVKGEGYRVMGEVYTVDDNMLAKLDEIESVPDRYHREELDVQLMDQPDDSEGPVKAWNYFATHYDEEMLQLPYLSNFTTN